jgi:hypothetical protein
MLSCHFRSRAAAERKQQKYHNPMTRQSAPNHRRSCPCSNNPILTKYFSPATYAINLKVDI